MYFKRDRATAYYDSKSRCKTETENEVSSLAIEKLLIYVVNMIHGTAKAIHLIFFPFILTAFFQFFSLPLSPIIENVFGLTKLPLTSMHS